MRRAEVGTGRERTAMWRDGRAGKRTMKDFNIFVKEDTLQDARVSATVASKACVHLHGRQPQRAMRGPLRQSRTSKAVARRVHVEGRLKGNAGKDS